MNIKRIIFLIILAFFCVEAEPFSLKRIACSTTDWGPDLYGFPTAAQSSIPWVNSFEQEIYIRGYLTNLLFWFALLFMMNWLLSKIKLFKSFFVNLRVIVGVLAVIYLTFIVIGFGEYRTWKWSSDSYDYIIKNCDVEIVFFPWK